ncbi:MBL fold metallo-hydrolase [Lachnospiraceae bacterium 54-53]
MLTYGVHQLKVQQAGFINYIYLIVDKISKQTAIVDPSWNYAAILNLINKLNVKVDALLLTHSHIDHVYMVDSLIEKYKDVKVYMSDIECQYYKYTTNNLMRLYDGDIIRLGDTEVTCILTPGHTKGSMCYLLQESIFTGDTIFAEGCGMCTSLGGDAYEMYQSIQKIKNMVKPHVRVYAGHSYGKNQGETLMEISEYNIYFQINDIKKFVEFRNRKGQNNLFEFT